MSSNVDERVVEMTFKGTSFVNGVQTAISALSKLKSSLNFSGAENSLSQLDSAGKKFSLGGIASGVDSIASKFSAFGILGVTALTNIANRAIGAGISIVKSLTIDPIKAGLDVYETKINSIQTILANTQASGTTLNQVTAALKELNTYANQTVFSFSDMTKNIGTFTAAGVNLKDSVSSIKGIANLAALSGSTSEQASTAMYQLSQAIASGTVKLQDWNSVVNAGLGGKTFQTALENTARASGVAIDSILKKAGGFRNSLQQGWLTSNVLTKTLSQFTGDLSEAQIKAMGFTDKEAQSILKLGKTAVSSATNIRTITQLMDALHEEVATAWSTVWETLIGNITKATSTLTTVHNVLENMFTKPIYDLNSLLQAWDKLGGRSELIYSIGTAFKILGSYLAPIKEAFRDIFPPVTAVNLMNIVLAFENFLAAIKPSKTTLEDIRKTFDGLFSILKIGIDIVKGVFIGLGEIFGAAKGGGAGVLSLTAKFGDFLVKLKNVIESGGFITKFFSGLGKILSLPIRAITSLSTVFGGLSTVAQKVSSAVSPALSKVSAAFSKLSQAIAQSIQNGSFSNVLNIINQGLFGAILLAVRNFIKNLGHETDSGPGLFGTIKESFESLTGALQAMQTNLKSGTLEKIAIAVALLTASLVALSFIDYKNLAKSLTAITILFAELITAMNAISKLSGAAGIVKLPVIAASLILLSTAILILASAVAILSKFSWEQLAKGLSAIAILLGELVGTIALMSNNSKGVYTAAVAMEAMAVAMNIMAGAVGKLGAMDWKTLLKGVGTIGALLLVIAGFNAISAGGTELITTAVAMIIVSEALTVLAKAVSTLGAMPLGDLAKGVVAIAASLLIIAAGLALMTGALPGAAALIVASAALVLLSEALTNMAGLSWNDVAKALVVLAGSLVIISAALILMEASLPGAAALIIAAGALAVLATVLVALGGLSWSDVAKGLVALAGTFVILGAAGILLTAAIPGLLGLGAAITLIGIGVLAAGAGVALFAVGLGAVAVALAATGVAIATFVSTVVGVLPTLASSFTQTISSFADGIAKAAPAIINAFVAVLTSLLNGIVKIAPNLVKAFEAILVGLIQILGQDAPKLISALATMVVNMLTALTSKAPQFVTAGINLIIAILNGIAANVGKVVTAAANIAISFINAIGAAGLRITQAGAQMIINFINGLARQINADAPQVRNAGLNLAEAIINGMTGGLLNGSTAIANAARSVASTALNAAKSLLGINSPSKVFDEEVGQPSGQGVVVGLLKTKDAIGSAAEEVGGHALSSLKNSLSGINDAINSNVDLQPKITPVIDLSEAQNGFATLNGMAKDQLISANTSLVKATSISADNASAAATIGSGGNSNNPSVTFNQYNTSPKALSSAEIYRQTKNQLSVVKEALPS